ncbi:hypothetical protein Q4543_17275 [Salipiger sp. 1_MG-2023]|uniref:hypothetical protein n=1 Tax=Salipiger sp. 1_MG-2023 TaxID=3062665 RepID=UPI0026E275A9|nr:hypothetical protein [Salipiger sp. 1_MG-2023]MDO6587267.1 hypothetical protein [Salipiger sp. 1_MG-2023]
MQFPSLTQFLAPLATGHPQGLPAVQSEPARISRVQPVKEQASTGTQTGTDQDPSAESRQMVARQSSQRISPPSVMQIRIAQMLQDQADKMQSESASAPKPADPQPQTAQTPDEPAPEPVTAHAPEPAPDPDTPKSAPPLPTPYASRADLPTDTGFDEEL